MRIISPWRVTAAGGPQTELYPLGQLERSAVMPAPSQGPLIRWQTPIRPRWAAYLTCALLLFTSGLFIATVTAAFGTVVLLLLAGFESRSGFPGAFACPLAALLAGILLVPAVRLTNDLTSDQYWREYYSKRRRCPYCGYQLRVAESPRCSECGSSRVPAENAGAPLKSHHRGEPQLSSNLSVTRMRGSALCIAFCLSSVCCTPCPEDADPAAQQVWRGFPAIPPIANVDPSTREERDFLVPTRVRIVRTENRLEVDADPDSLESITLDVGTNMVVGFRTEQLIYEDGQLVSSGGYGLGGDWYFGTSGYNTRARGFPQPGKSYEVELRIHIFETDIPPQHLWMPESPKYKVLWTRTIRQST